MNENVIISVRNLRKSFDGKEILKGISLDVLKGDVITIIGSSGSGKSTFLRCLNKLEEADFGEIYFEGTNILDKHININKIREKVGMCFQSFNLFNNKNVIDNCMLALRKIKHLKKEEARAIAIEELTKVGMQDFLNAKVSSLSGGQKQRVAIARALCMKPDVMLFDEPTSALDPEMVGEVLAVMKKLALEGMTMVVVTHEMDFAFSLADRVVFMEDGLVIKNAPPKEYLENNDNERINKFIKKIVEK